MSASCWFFRALWLPLMLAAAATEEQQGEDCSAKWCGILTISDPFWLSDEEAPRSCGPQDFEVACHNKSFPGLRSSIPGSSGFAIIDISYKENSLRVVDRGNLELLQASNSCQGMILNISVKLARPFKIDPAGLNLILYNCTEEAAAAAVARRDRELVQTSLSCGNKSNMFVRTGVRYDVTGNYGGYALDGCDAVVTPVLGSSSGGTNATDYVQLINDGFLLTWDPSLAWAGTMVGLGRDAWESEGRLDAHTQIAAQMRVRPGTDALMEAEYYAAHGAEGESTQVRATASSRVRGARRAGVLVHGRMLMFRIHGYDNDIGLTFQSTAMSTSTTSAPSRQPDL